jgi:fructose/tagatose bisphosphate aldolase
MATTATSMIEQARELMRRSRHEHFAVGAFNVDNQETLLAIVRAAKAKESPVLVEVSHDEVSMIGLANIRSLVDNYRAVSRGLGIGARSQPVSPEARRRPTRGGR